MVACRLGPCSMLALAGSVGSCVGEASRRGPPAAVLCPCRLRAGSAGGRGEPPSACVWSAVAGEGGCVGEAERPEVVAAPAASLTTGPGRPGGSCSRRAGRCEGLSSGACCACGVSGTVAAGAWDPAAAVGPWGPAALLLGLDASRSSSFHGQARARAAHQAMRSAPQIALSARQCAAVQGHAAGLRLWGVRTRWALRAHSHRLHASCRPVSPMGRHPEARCCTRGKQGARSTAWRPCQAQGGPLGGAAAAKAAQALRLACGSLQLSVERPEGESASAHADACLEHVAQHPAPGGRLGEAVLRSGSQALQGCPELSGLRHTACLPSGSHAAPPFAVRCPLSLAGRAVLELSTALLSFFELQSSSWRQARGVSSSPCPSLAACHLTVD